MTTHTAQDWVLVPREPTDAMTFTGQQMRYDAVNSIGAIYRAMLDASPQPDPPASTVSADRLPMDEIRDSFEEIHLRIESIRGHLANAGPLAYREPVSAGASHDSVTAADAREEIAQLEREWRMANP
jgi:hypothetical protein